MIKEAFLKAADSLFRELKNKPEIISSIKALQLSRSYTALWSNGQEFDTAASERHRRLQVFLTVVRQVYRHQRYSPDVCFYLDGVYRYDWKRGAINITAPGRLHFSVIQQLYGENHQLLVFKLCAILMALCHLFALLLSICTCNTKDYTTLSILVKHCEYTQYMY